MWSKLNENHNFNRYFNDFHTGITKTNNIQPWKSKTKYRIKSK